MKFGRKSEFPYSELLFRLNFCMFLFLHFYKYGFLINYVSRIALFLFSFDVDRRIRFEALQSEAGKKLLRRSGRAPDDISSVVIVEKDR